MSDTIVLDGDITLDVMLDGEAENTLKVGHEVILQSIDISENGRYDAPFGIDGYNHINVNIPAPIVQSKIVEPMTTQQIIEPDDGYDYLSSVTVNKYFNPFAYMTGFSNVFASATLPETTVIDFDGAVVESLYKTFNSLKGCRHLIIKNLQYQDGTGVSCQDLFRGASIEVLEFVNCLFRPANNQYPFYQSMLQEIIGEIDMTYRTAGIINDMQYLREIRFVPSTIHDGFSIYNTRTLSEESLISIANGFDANAPGEYDIRRSYLFQTIQAITGNVVDGMFVADNDGEITLEQFIVNTKGWSINA